VTWLIPLMGALGLVLAIGGLPPLRRGNFRARVEPYVGGLRGRPSDLLVRPQPTRRGRLERVVESLLVRVGLTSNDHLQDRLTWAGQPANTGAFRLDQLVWGLAAMVSTWCAVVMAVAIGIGVDVRALPALSALAVAGGFAGRDWWLSRQIEQRRAVLREELPTAIDLLALSIMAGESVPASMGRVGPALGGEAGKELLRVVADVRAGATTAEALEGLKHRVPVLGVGRLVDALVTAIEKGTPLADVLRSQSDDGREGRRRQLIEMGGRREVLMLVPVVFLIMPVVVVFALLPGLVTLDLLVR
jgi:tight adherence protein C